MEIEKPYLLFLGYEPGVSPLVDELEGRFCA
jgi:hypothetical protein